jgi:hypothetical protein
VEPEKLPAMTVEKINACVEIVRDLSYWGPINPLAERACKIFKDGKLIPDINHD